MHCLSHGCVRCQQQVCVVILGSMANRSPHRTGMARLAQPEARTRPVDRNGIAFKSSKMGASAQECSISEIV